MTREEFESKYAQKYMGLSFVHNPAMCMESIESLRDGEGYTDHHIDLCWRVQKIKDMEISYDGWIDMCQAVNDLEW